MNKYILVAFAFIGIGFYELSGGSDFVPGDTSLVVFADPRPAAPSVRSEPTIVARADNAASVLTDIAPARALVTPVQGAAGRSPTQVSLTAAIDTETPVARSPETVANVASLPEPSTEPDLRFIDGDLVNMRGGPGTDYAVIGKLYRNDLVEIIEDEGNGWLHLRDTLSGDEGWIAEWLVTAAN